MAFRSVNMHVVIYYFVSGRSLIPIRRFLFEFLKNVYAIFCGDIKQSMNPYLLYFSDVKTRN